MIKPLRRYHFFAWCAITVLLPIVFVLAVIMRPRSLAESGESANSFELEARKLTDTTGMLTVELKSELKAPTCLVYLNDLTKRILIGKIERRGKYQFAIPITDNSITVQLYDAIHKKDLSRKVLSLDNK